MTDTTKQFVTVDGDQILWVEVTDYDGRRDHDLLSARDGRYVRAWKSNGRDTWQVCAGGSRMGSTLTWHGATTEDMAREFARGVKAKFYSTKTGIERAIERALAAA